jgi:hypothetical protein
MNVVRLAGDRLDATAVARTTGRDRARRTAFVMSGVVAALMAAGSAWGMFVHGVYHEIPWAAEAMRGGDLTTLVLATPMLIASLGLSRRGSSRAVLIWAGVLGYNVYNHAYFAFGASFNDLFLLHILVLSLSTWALVFLLASLDAAFMAACFGTTVPARAVATLLGAVGLALTALWTTSIVRQVVTGELPAGAAPPAALHMVWATDLAIFVSPTLVAAVLLWLRTAWGYIGGTVMAVVGATYLVNLALAQLFQAHAHVTGVAPVPTLAVGLDLCYWLAAWAMLRDWSARPPDESGAGPG